MAIDSEQVASWIGKGLALESGSTDLPIDYVSINRRVSARSWPQHARIEAAGRAPLDVIGDVLEHLADIGHNSAAEGLTTYSVRVFLYRASGIPAGSRTFRAELPGTGFDEDEDSDGTLMGELVATVRELRLLARDQGQQIERASGLGYKLAADALAQAGALQAENAALMVAIAESSNAANGNKSAHLAELAQAVLPMVPALLGAGAERRAAHDAATGGEDLAALAAAEEDMAPLPA